MDYSVVIVLLKSCYCDVILIFLTFVRFGFLF